MVPDVDVRAIREGQGLTREQFAERYGLASAGHSGMGARETQTGTGGTRVYARYQEPARRGAEGLDSRVARPGSEESRGAPKGDQRSGGRHCSRMSLPQDDQAGSVAQNAGFGTSDRPKSNMATTRPGRPSVKSKFANGVSCPERSFHDEGEARAWFQM